MLYFNVRFNDRDNEILQKTTADLIDVAHHAGGPTICPTSYPEVDDFFAMKRKYDPSGRFSNKFYEKYGM